MRNLFPQFYQSIVKQKYLNSERVPEPYKAIRLTALGVKSVRTAVTQSEFCPLESSQLVYFEFTEVSSLLLKSI